MIRTGYEQMDPVKRAVSASMLRRLEAVTGLTPSEWHGKCYQMAFQMVKHGLATGAREIHHDNRT